ncbi:MAG: hypothetical protein ACRD1K_07460 [Acidimicrobiales bacterium]
MAARSVPRRVTQVLVAMLALFLVAGCQDGDADRPAVGSRSTETVADGPEASAPEGATPQPSPQSAVEAVLAAEQVGDHATSYRLISSAGRDGLDEPAWARRRTEVPAITSFRIDGRPVDGPDGSSVVALVDHEPGLDPFLGLSPGRERQTWQAHRQGGGWLVDPDPVVVPQYPPEQGASEMALNWSTAVQACDGAGAARRQGVGKLFGRPEAATGLCGSTGTLVAGPARPAPPGPDTADLVAQFGPETLSWARAVQITGGVRTFSVVLAPIGSVWKVVAVIG